MITVDSTVSRILRNKPLDQELIVSVDNAAITATFRDAIERSALEKSVVYVHTRHETRPYYLRSVVIGDHGVTAEILLTPRVSTMYAHRIDIWLNGKSRVIICNCVSQGGVNE